MSLLARINARLVGFRMILFAALFAVPDDLNALVGFEGYGAKIGAGLGLLRLVLIPVMNNIRAAARDGARQGARDPGGDPR